MTPEEKIERIARVLCRSAGDPEDVISSSGLFPVMRGGRAMQLWEDTAYNADLRFWPGWMNYAQDAIAIANQLGLVPIGHRLNLDQVKRWKVVEDTERQYGELTDAA